MEPWVGNKFLLGRKIGSGSFREIYLRPLTQYKALVDQGKLQYDPYQETIASELENLVKKLEQYNKVMEEYHVSLSKWEEIREHERCRILVKEAEVKKEGGAMASVKKWPSRIFENLMSWLIMLV
ncbi:uncharacterized protein LOC141663577 isoform X1 [Apium graveolens]|uniref:uncharacterized protein LOC141663577 isoform X1 n=1 Tax=Apium graveolens TaxID=4045 RepID=UPI003D797A9A